MRHWLCLSLPNSGSDWFADLVAQCTRGAKYFRKEYFNPITNWPHLDTLAIAFGCELPSTARHLHKQIHGILDDDDEAEMLSIIDDTWGKQEQWNCNKEVWSFGNARVFQKRFQLWGLTRSASTLFPPSRARVWAWYDAIACAAGLQHTGGRLEQRCRAAHKIGVECIHNSATELDFPVLDYDKLVTGTPDEVMHEIDKLYVEYSVVDGIDRDLLFRRVFDERRPKHVQSNGIPSASS